jgi:hypothetical protein
MFANNEAVTFQLQTQSMKTDKNLSLEETCSNDCSGGFANVNTV